MQIARICCPSVWPVMRSAKTSTRPSVHLQSCRLADTYLTIMTLCEAPENSHHRALPALQVRVVRIFNTYGPRMALDDGRVVSNFVAQALTDQDLTVYGDGQQTRSFQYVSDLIKGMTFLHTGQNASHLIKGVITHAQVETSGDFQACSRYTSDFSQGMTLLQIGLKGCVPLQLPGLAA